MKTVGALKYSVASLLTGIDLAKVVNVYGALERAARTVVQQADAPEASGRKSYMLYDGVYDYPAPISIFGSSFNDLRPQGVSRNPWDYVYKQPIELFDRTKSWLPNGYQVTFEWDKGIPIMRVAQHKADAQVQVDGMNALTGWEVGGTASDLELDSTVFYHTPGSLRFNLVGSGTGYIEKTLESPLTLSNYEGVAVGFLALYTPNVENLTSIELRIGSDSSNYSLVTETEGFLGAWIVDTFLLVAFDLAGSSTVGTPDYDNIQWTKVSYNHTGSITNIRAGDLFLALPSAHELLYETDAIYKDASTNDLLTDITADSNYIILNNASYTLLEYESACQVILQNSGGKGGALYDKYYSILHHPTEGLYNRYRADNPSEEIRSVGSWYDDGGYGR